MLRIALKPDPEIQSELTDFQFPELPQNSTAFDLPALGSMLYGEIGSFATMASRNRNIPEIGPTLGRRLDLGAHGRVEVPADQRQQITKHTLPEEELLGRHTAGAIVPRAGANPPVEPAYQLCDVLHSWIKNLLYQIIDIFRGFSRFSLVLTCLVIQKAP